MSAGGLGNLAGLSVSRETIQTLEAFETLVRRWNPVINLVSKASLPELWSRHITDSAQLLALCPLGAMRWYDLGSGGGFPGIVIAALSKELQPQLKVSLVEADLRKATLLRESCRALALNAEVHSERIESLAPASADVLSARALAPLTDLLAYADQHLADSGVALFPKGNQYESELIDARKAWSFDINLVPSLLDNKSAILEIRNIRRAGQQ